MKPRVITQRRIQRKVVPYVPQYKQMDIEPEQLDFQSGVQVQQVSQEQSPRLRTFGHSIAQKEVPILNQEDGNSFEFIENNKIIDSDTPMIDNNNFIEDEVIKEEAFSVSDLQPEQYVLIVGKNIFSIGTNKEIENEINLLIFGNHPRCNEQISVENLIVLKRIDMKAGVFLNE